MLIIWIAIIMTTLIVGYGATSAVKYRLTVRRSKATPVLQAEPAEDKPELSWAASDLIYSFNNLPEDNRPGIDIEAAVRAIDIKYSVWDINSHYMAYESYRYNSRYARDPSRTWNCSCVYDPENRENLSESCDKYPEFWVLKDAISEVKTALYEREQALLAHERAMELAGIESDLRSVNDIAAALRAERDALAQATDMLELR